MTPLVIGSLFVIGHDAAHNSLTPVGWLNRLLGRLVFLPAWHPYTSWTHSHNTMHHGWTMFKGRHPDFPPFTKAEYDALPFWRRMLERVYRSPLGNISRALLRREVVTVGTEYGAVQVKLAHAPDGTVNVAPEYDDCRRIARERGVPLKAVYQAAIAAARR